MSEDIKQKKTIEDFKQLLKDHGYTMYIGGCGCCGSPSVSIDHDGQEIFESDSRSLEF